MRRRIAHNARLWISIILNAIIILLLALTSSGRELRLPPDDKKIEKTKFKNLRDDSRQRKMEYERRQR